MRKKSKASVFIAHKIPLLRKEGYKEKQAIAISFSMARAKGYKTGKRRKRR